MTKTLIVVAALCGALAVPAHADHNNPWATADDVVLSKNHEANQAKSADTPGNDEMRGVMVRSAHGKLGTAPGRGRGKR